MRTSPAPDPTVTFPDDGSVAAALQFGRDSAVHILDLDVEGVADPVVLVEHAEGRDVEVVELDLSARRGAPPRRYGTTRLHTPGSLVEWVARTRGDQEPALYADVDSFTLVAVLNPSDTEPTWQDHRGQCQLRTDPLFARWAALDGKTVPQEEFAEHVQLCAGDIAEPPSLDLLEVAETLALHSTSKVSSAVRLRDGARHIVFDDNIDATAGSADREVDVPERIRIRVPIFEGGDTVDVWIRLMYRRAQTGVAFRLQIVDCLPLVRGQFQEVVEVVGADLSTTPLMGCPTGRP